MFFCLIVGDIVHKKGAIEAIEYDDSELLVKARTMHIKRMPAYSDIIPTNTFIHDEIEIKLFRCDGTLVVVENESISVSEGDIIVTNPYEFHSTISVPDEGCMYDIVMVNMDAFPPHNNCFPDLRRIYSDKSIKFCHHIKGNRRASAIIERVIEEYAEKKKDYQKIVRCLLTEFFVLLIRDYTVPADSDGVFDVKARYHSRIEPAICRIMSDYSSDMSLDELAAECNMSKYHFCRVFKAITGMTVLGYLNEYRLKVADYLLNSSDKNISEIATACGFDDSTYFCRCYKKSRGISPRRRR